jgi:hypothetical protein
MATASLNLSVIQPRMMSDVDSADYCGMPTKHFKATCPVQPVNMGGRVLRYDKQDLDKWIDSEKLGVAETSRDSILARLR